MKDQHDDRLTKNAWRPTASPCCHCWTVAVGKNWFRNVCICMVLCAMLNRALCNWSADFVVLTNPLLRLCTHYIRVCVCVCTRARACVCVSACRVLVGTAEGKKLLAKTWRIWDDNIKIGPKEVGWGDMDWIALAQDRGRWRANVNAVLKLPSSIKCGEFIEYLRNC